MTSRDKAQSKAQTAALQIIKNPKQRKKFQKLMLEGEEWIFKLCDLYGPFSGYELNEFISTFKEAKKKVPKSKSLPKAYETNSSEIKRFESSAAASKYGSETSQETASKNKLIEQATNEFCQQGTKFTFKAKQRFKDINQLIQTYGGEVPEYEVLHLPEKECEEIQKPLPLHIDERFEAFILEEIPSAPEIHTETKEKPPFVSKFSLPDKNTRKAMVAKKQATEKHEPVDTSKHRFRDDYEPKAYGKSDFMLRLPKPEAPKQELVTEPLEKFKPQMKAEKKQQEEQLKLRRTFISGNYRGEWEAKFKPTSKTMEMGTKTHHKVLPREDYVPPVTMILRDD